MVLAVTVLTSLSDADLSEIGVSRGTCRRRCYDAGSRWPAPPDVVGWWPPPWKPRELRRELGEDFDIVTPGVRPAGTALGDQARVLTPREAIAAGATYLVVGRPILDATDPSQAADAIVGEIEEAKV